MYKLDLHTHSEASPDGSLRVIDYKRMLESGALDYVAITDHNRIDFAIQLQKVLGDSIIVGEEIMTNEGEIIGLYLKKAIPGGMSLKETIHYVKDQQAIVYVPHPFETIRSGISPTGLDAIASDVQIVEVFNGRAIFQNRSKQSHAWAKKHAKAMAASSDSHGPRGWGKTYTLVDEKPTHANLVDCLQTSQLSTRYVGVYGMLYPKLNRLRKNRFHHVA
jgi:predicted metal-dependent phosphoesterase TrpH